MTTSASEVTTARTASVIVPTYREAGNLPTLIARLGAVRERADLDLELIICDDDSRDGTGEVVEQAAQSWVRLIVRTRDRGLSAAVLEGLRAAKYDRLVVMDADLSHPPEKIPELLDRLAEGADFVIGSRYVAGGSTDANWGLLRWINSRVATLLARPFTRALDPMSGFFALERETLRRAAALDPIGYKIGLELIVKCGCERVAEVPIFFADREVGESKLNLKEQLLYLSHVRRLLAFKHPTASGVAAAAVAVGAVVVPGLLVGLGRGRSR